VQATQIQTLGNKHVGSRHTQTTPSSQSTIVTELMVALSTGTLICATAKIIKAFSHLDPRHAKVA